MQTVTNSHHVLNFSSFDHLCVDNNDRRGFPILSLSAYGKGITALVLVRDDTSSCFNSRSFDDETVVGREPVNVRQ